MLGLGHKKVANVEPFERAIVDEELGGALQEVRPSEIVDPHARSSGVGTAGDEQRGRPAKPGMMAGLKKMFSKKSLEDGDAPSSLSSSTWASPAKLFKRAGSSTSKGQHNAKDGSEKQKGEGGAWKWKRKESVAELAAKQSKSEVEVLQMGKYLGVDLGTKEGSAFRWLVEEALVAPLPDDWEEHKTEEGAVYYYSPVLKESTWEHPLDGYYRFLHDKMLKMRRANKQTSGDYSEKQRVKDRELVDLLWAMDQEKKQTEFLEESEISGFVESREGGFYPEGPSGREGGGGGAAVPEQVKEIADYLGIDMQALEAPVSPDEVKEMAGYLGINCITEGYLLHLAKVSLLAPLPKGWEIYKDAQGEPFYMHRGTKKTSYRHPADEYFISRVLQDRNQHVRAMKEQHGTMPPPAEPWMEFQDGDGSSYWYNFRTSERSSVQPAGALGSSIGSSKERISPIRGAGSATLF